MPLPDPGAGREAFDSAAMGAALLVVGGTAEGSGLSVVFEEGPPDLYEATLHPTAWVDPSVRAFYGAAGTTSGAYLAGITTSGAVRVAKVTARNELDASFGTGGYVTIPLSAGETANGAGIVVDAKGRLVVAYSLSSSGITRVARLTPSGAIDPAFGPSGREAGVLNPKGERLDVRVDLEGEILVPGLVPAADGAPIQGGYVRIHESGARDPSYGTQGIMVAPPRKGPERPRPDRVVFSLSPDARSCAGVGGAFMFVVESGQPSVGVAFVP